MEVQIQHLQSQLQKQGLAVVENLNPSYFKEFDAVINQELKDILAADYSTGTVDFKSINSRRINAFRAVNRIQNWEQKYFEMGKNYLNELLGPDLLIQRKLNLSVQIPKDTTSTLGIHADTLSGQSPFELVMWTAFTDVFDTNGMFYFDIDTSKKIFDDMAKLEVEGLEYLREKYWDKVKFLNMKKGQLCIFTGTIFHGNIPNRTNSARVSINCRFKNIFSPNGTERTTDRAGGIFYKFLQESVVSEIAREYLKRSIKF